MRVGLVLAGMIVALSSAALAQTAPAAKPAAPPQVVVQTSMGDITITLDPVHAPKTTENFLRYVAYGHYNGAAIFRIEQNYLIQLGDLDADGRYRPPRYLGIPLETATTKHSRGAVALAHGDDPNSGQTSFYFDLAENEGLNAKPGAPPNTTGFAVFGHVTDGMDVLDKIAAVERAPGGPFPGKGPKVPIVVKTIVVK